MKAYSFMLLFLTVPAAYGFTCNTNLIGVMETDSGYEGVIADLTVYSLPGEGRVFVQTMPLTEIDTQASARLAQEVSCSLLGVDCSAKDFFYIIESDHPMIGGPSAGAAMTACTLSVLLNKTLKSDVVMTGAINPDGSVGPVGSVLEKASVLEGFNKFLIPVDSATQLVLINGSLTKVDIPSFAELNYGLEVITVNDIIEAFKHLSGYEIVLRNVSSSEVASQEYSNVMRLMAGSLINHSSSFVFNETDESLLSLINDAEGLLTDARSYFDNSTYYSAASFAVRSLILNYYAYNIINYDNMTSAESLINETINDINSFEQDLKQVQIDHIYDLESYSITIDRLNEAKDLINDSFGKSLTESLYYAAFAEVRLLTAEQWLSLIEMFSSNKTIEFNQLMIRQLALERLEQARNAITYAKTIVPESYLINAEDHLARAYQAYDDVDIIYSLFEALKSRAEANLVMETRGLTNYTLKISSKKEAALRAIVRAEERGLLPLLSLSYLEYADSFVEEEPEQALIFLSYAIEFSGISGDISEALNSKTLTTRPDFTLVNYYDDYDLVNQLLFLIIGFIAGLLIALVRYESD